LNVSLYIARRYLISKKSHNFINIISAISVTGVAIGAMALIIVLSVFNGFDRLVISLFNTFNPSFQITPARGKTFDATTFPPGSLRNVDGVRYITEVIEENALLKYKDEQSIVTIKGVSEEFVRMSGLDTMMAEGRLLLQDGENNYAVLGIGVAGTLGANLRDYLTPLSVYVPGRDATPGVGLDQAFNSGVIFPSGFFQVQWEYDVRYVIVPLRFTKELLQYDRERTSIEIATDPKADQNLIKRKLEKIAGPGFIVKNRYQQQEVLYKIMLSEKYYIFMILTLILIIATFNVIGTLSMLILDKKEDIRILQSLGASKQMISRIFMTEGLLISLIGAVTGLVAGALICLLQIRFGLVRLGDENSSFVVDAYPVHLQAGDFFLVFFTVMIIGFLATWYPVRNINKMHLAPIADQ
jgi:lipoprotein-releasing system permease protein